MDAYPALNPAEELIWALVKKVKIKFRNRMDNTRAGYSMTLPKDEALAFEFWMNEMRKEIQPDTYKYELNTADQITNEINRLYG